MLGSAREAAGRLNKYARYEGLTQVKKKSRNSAAHSLTAHELSAAHKFAVSRFPCLPASAKPAIGDESADTQIQRDICPATRSSNGSEENPKSAVGDESAALAADDAAAALARSDSKLLKGSVPQLQDWIDTWIAVTEGHSIRMQRRTQKKNGRIVRSRHCIRKQRRILAEHVREKNRILLRAATSITLALDKGKYKKVVRFRCDTPMPVSDGKPAVAKGVLGIVDCTHASAADHEEDHAIKAVRKLDGLITTFCSPLGPGGQPLAPDLSLKEHILKNVRALAADGASEERRALARAVHQIF